MSIKLSGQQHLDRSEGDDETTLNQKVEMEIDDWIVAVEFKGLESRQSLPVYSTHPAVIAHYRDLDHAQMVLQIAERDAVPEPIRLPVGAVPAGMMICELCEGSGFTGDPDAPDMEIECPDCKGEGLVIDEWAAEDGDA